MLRGAAFTRGAAATARSSPAASTSYSAAPAPSLVAVRRRRAAAGRRGPRPAPATPGPEPPTSPPPTPPPAPADPEAAALAELGTLWESTKAQLAKDLTPEERRVLESIKVDDLADTSPVDLMRKVADEQLAPLLRELGVEEEALAFFVDLLRLATALQLASAGVLFYSAELGGGLDAGEAFRCVAGLGVGYLSRPFYRVELLLWPLYSAALRAVVPGAVYEVSGSADEAASTLTRLGVSMALASLLPQLLWGWDTATSLQFVLPMAAGWFLFDVAYMAALLYKLRP